MRTLLILLGLLLSLAAPARGEEPLTRTYGAPETRVWAAVEAVLRHLGWEIDEADRQFGLVTTDSRRLRGEDFGVYEKGLRHRLRVRVRPVGAERTTVTVERAVFRRERILWMETDEPVAATDDRRVEQGFLDALGKAL